VNRWTRHVAVAWIAVALLPAGGQAAGTWALRLEGPGYGALLDVAVCESVILTVGATNHLHMPPYEGDVLIVSVSPEGDVLWETTWGSEGYEQAWGVSLRPDGGALVFGETDSLGAGDRDFFLIRLDASGEVEWVETYGTSQREWPFGMLELSDGDVLLYGRTNGSAGGPENLYAVRVADSGELVWTFTEETTASEIILDAIETGDGGIVLCASHEEDPMLVALDASGERLWTVPYELPGWQFGSVIAPVADGGFLLAGFSMLESGRRQADVWLARTSADGALLWETTFGRSGEDDYAQSLLAVADGTFLIGGLGQDLPLYKVDADGTVLWERRLAEGAVFAANGLAATEDGGAVIAALKQIVNGRSYDALLLRVDSAGRLQP